MSDVHYVKHRVFRETQDVIFYDISVEKSNASDLVVHTGKATSPPDDAVGAKQFYIHKHQTDHNRVVSGERTFELVNFDWRYPYHIVHFECSEWCVDDSNTYLSSFSIRRYRFDCHQSGSKG